MRFCKDFMNESSELLNESADEEQSGGCRRVRNAADPTVRKKKDWSTSDRIAEQLEACFDCNWSGKNRHLCGSGVSQCLECDG